MKKNLYLLSLLTIGALLAGCKENKDVYDPTKDNTEALLINKENHLGSRYDAYSFFYFDTDGNPDNAEIILAARSANSAYLFLNSFNKAKIGEYKTISQWHSDLIGNPMKFSCEYIKE